MRSKNENKSIKQKICYKVLLIVANRRVKIVNKDIFDNIIVYYTKYSKNKLLYDCFV